MEKTKNKIIICKSCFGKGKKLTKRIIDPHKNIYEPIMNTCEDCKGIGRLLKIIKINIEPFKGF